MLCLSVCLSVCMYVDHGQTVELNDVIFAMLTLMIPRGVIGYIIFTSLFIKGQERSKKTKIQRSLNLCGHHHRLLA